MSRTHPLLVSSALAGLVLGCAPAEPYYDDDIGVSGVATEPGALAGVFGHKVFAATLVQIPVPGLEDELGGGFQWLRVERAWDTEAQLYRQTSRLCAGQNVEVHGTVGDVPPETYRAVPDSENESVVVDHATGELAESGLLQLWGIRGLTDPANDPLPASADEARSGDYASKVYDMDGDGELGYTTAVSGLVNGEAWGVLRRRSSNRGAVLSPDRVFGLVDTDYDSTIFGASDPSVEQLMGGKAPPYPDPKASWFEELRLPDDADCDDVEALEADAAFLRRNPY
jgi:hypothetical protein